MKIRILKTKILTTGRPLRGLAVVLASLGMFSSAMALSISTPFTEATLPGWTIDGGATLTAATHVDPAGSGWLRLTENTGDQSSTATYNTAFPSTDGLVITFQYATWGGSGADGFSMYLIDGSVTSPTIGARGGALGYSNGNGPGVTKGYVGIGFDEWGNFSNSGYGGDCVVPCATGPDLLPNRVAVRGAGDQAGSPSEFRLLASEPAGAIATGTTDRGNIATVQVTITPAPNPTITVQRDTGSGYVTIINGLSLANNGAVPATFKMGFSASTGGSTNFHEIRNLTIQDLQTATGSTVAPVAVPVFGPYGLILLLTSMGSTFLWAKRRRR